MIATLEELDNIMNVLREKVWAQAVLFTCDVTNKPTTTSMQGRKSPYELLFGTAPTPDYL